MRTVAGRRLALGKSNLQGAPGLRRVCGHGTAALAAKPHPGSQSRLSEINRARLDKLLLAGAPTVGFPSGLWTCPHAAVLIGQRFGVEYHLAHAW